MKTDMRLDQKGLKVVTATATQVGSKTAVCRKRILGIVQSAEHLASGCIVYRLAGPAIG